LGRGAQQGAIERCSPQAAADSQDLDGHAAKILSRRQRFHRRLASPAFAARLRRSPRASTLRPPMSENQTPTGAPPIPSEATRPRVGLGEIFRDFLLMGATSFGGGVVAYLHENLVTGKAWVDEEEFLSALEISQTLPGLNAINMSILVGDR